MGKSRYADILTHHPMPVVAVILVIVVSCTLLNVFVAKPPDFSDPLQGFMPRHTAIHSSYSTWKNILENTAIGSEAKTLTMYPRSDNSEANLNSINHMTSLSAGQSDNESAVTGAMLRRDLARSRRDLAMLRRDLSEGEEGDMTYDTTTSYLSLMYMKEFSDKEKYFCADRPMERYAQLVFSVDISDIGDLSYTHYSKLCELQSLSESSSNYEPVCQRGCHCNSFSLVNYISYLSHQSSCHKVTHKDLNQALQLVVKCRQYYSELDLDCWYDEVDKFYVKRCNVSAECADKSMYEMYHFILSKPSEAENILVISYLHVAQSVSTHEFYLDIHQLIRQRPPDRGVKLISLDFGLKETVFENSLLTDSGWVGLALAIVVLIMIMYTESVFITFMTFISMLFTIILSFTVYQFVFRIEDFPFMNLLAAIVVVGIGADDLFIFWKTWMAIKHSRNASILERIVTYTFQHAASAMFVTSASTATAFYASAYTDMISIRCFCIYAGTCVLIHYVLVITWLPACVVLYECHSLNVCYSTGKKSKITRLINHLYTASTSTMQRLLERQSEISTFIIWIPLFGLISLAGVIFLTVWPKFTAPSTHMFQMLSASHPFEVYDRDVKPRFDFTSNHEYLPVIFVFGIEPCFNGRYFDLISVGDLVFKPLPDFGSEESQRWFSDFCWNLRQQDFFDSTYSQPHGCFIEEMRAWLRFRSCSSDPICCEDLTFPYNQSVYLHCLDTWNKETSDYRLTTMQPGLRYKDGIPSLVVITFWSNIKFTYNFLQMESFYQNVTSFVDKTMKDCSLSSCDSYRPMVTTAGGWLFYDIQNTLLESLPPTLGVVLSASALIIFITTQNILLTLCSLISISCSIVTMLGVLSLMRWELNILESVIVSLAVGLSMDFPLHVAVAYRTANSTSDRQTRASLSLRHVGGSLTAAMMTTLVAGICMLPAQVLAYTKLGTFLALVALISWFYATFFMPSLLVRIGPVGNCSQLNHKMCRRRRSSHPGRSHDKTVYSEEISESEIMTTLPTPVPSPHLALEPVIEESEEEISDLEIEDINASASMSLLTATSPSLKRLTPITECDYDSSESIQS